MAFADEPNDHEEGGGDDFGYGFVGGERRERLEGKLYLYAARLWAPLWVPIFLRSSQLATTSLDTKRGLQATEPFLKEFVKWKRFPFRWARSVRVCLVAWSDVR